MSAQVEEVTASAQSLSEMAQALQAVVAQFRLGGDGDGRALASPVPISASHPGGNGHAVPVRQVVRV